MTIPTLPEGYEPHELPADYTGPLWIESQMQAYRAAALEEAAKFIENGSFLYDQSPAKLFAEQLAPKIRGLK